MKHIEYVIVAFILIIVTSSCTDIIDCEKNKDKEYILKMMSPSDSLKKLEIKETDFGSLKMMSTSTKSIRLINTGNSHKIEIYSIISLNGSGIFTYKYTSGIPFIIEPGEDTEVSGKITAKFNAGVFNTGYYYDTLILNYNREFYVPVKAYVRY